MLTLRGGWSAGPEPGTNRTDPGGTKEKHVKKLVLGSVLGLGLTLASACSTTDPCATLPPPTPQQIQAADTPPGIEGAVLEIEIQLADGTECELVDGRWVAEADSSS